MNDNYKCMLIRTFTRNVFFQFKTSGIFIKDNVIYGGENLSKEIETIDVLKDLYKDVSDWLKFGEAKNVALLTFNGVLLFGILRLIQSNNSGIFNELLGTLHFCSFVLSINIVIILFSFLPALKQTDHSKNMDYKEFMASRNYLFYGHINDLNEMNLLEAISEKYKLDTAKNKKLYSDYGLQILSVSSIAWRKYKFFTFCTYINVAVFILIILRIIFLIFV